MEQEMEQLKGEVVSIVFRNEDTGFCVFDFDVGGELTCVVGEFTDITEGEGLLLHGKFVHHPTYGMQFKAAVCEHILPSTAGAILKYLSSGALKGIGPVYAKRIVGAFGDQSLRVLEQEPLRLCEIKGITEAKARKMSDEYKQANGVRAVMLYLSQYDIEPQDAIRIWKKWGVSTQENLAENPYQLCGEDFGLPFPKVDTIAAALEFEAENPLRLQAGIEHVLRENLSAGHTCLPWEPAISVTVKLLDCEPETVSAAIRAGLESEALYSVEKEGREYIYLPQLYFAEQYIAQRILMMCGPDSVSPSVEDAEIDLLETEQNIQFASLQREAIRSALGNRAFILTGGPGTGKTTTLKGILGLLDKHREKTALAAPTGRAAKRMSEMTGREAKTIHRLLEVDTTDPQRRRFKHNEKNPLGYDVIILDEVSMVDTLLLESLLRAMPLKARLIMVGDADQLPSVSAGNVLRDLIDSGVVPIVKLSEIFRQAKKSLIVLAAHDIVSGKIPNLSAKNNDLFFLGRLNDPQTLSTIGDLVRFRLPNAYHFSPLWDIQVIAPTRVGPLGTAAINQLLQSILNPEAPGKKQLTRMGITFREQDKVMQVKNNYDIAFEKDDDTSGSGVFNGDIGVIELIDRGSRTMFIRFEDRVAEYPFDLADQLELAYAITVHKSQGSEFEAVIFPLTSYHSRMHYRNLFYTAVTRARKLLILVGARSSVGYMISHKRRTIRYTGLKEFLTDGIGYLGSGEEA